MDRTTAITEIRSRWRDLYPADKKNKGIVCPLCGSGSGKNGTGITSNSSHGKPYSLKCWACDFSGDVIDLIQQEQNVDFNQALNIAANELGVVIDAYNSVEAARRDFNITDDKTHVESTKAPAKATETPTAAVEDYTAYYAKCQAALKDQAALSYLTARGISQETAEQFGVGYDAAWISPTVRKTHQAKGDNWLPEPTARIILPVSKNYYIARAAKDVEKYAKMNETGGGSVGIFNTAALYFNCTGSVFVVEGIFDAMSIYEVGGEALAINSTSNVNLFLKGLEQQPTTETLILCLDNDDKGKTAQNTLIEGLKHLNISFITADITGSYKDANEALTGDKKAFAAAVKKAMSQTAAKPDNVSEYIDTLMRSDIEKLKEAAEKKTGFEELDKLSGGLYPGLYVIAATSSLGKTTFAHQISDNLAAAGTDVLFFSMEQSRLELVSKSIARLTAKADMKTAVTSLAIRKGVCTDAVKAAAAKYKADTADRLSIVEGNFNCTISFIGEYIRRYIRQNDCKPVVVVDYLQILQPAEDNKRATVKETVDNTVTELKRISREHDLTVFIISSVNRANYLTPIDFESLKESGGIEYTADVIWGLQLRCLNEPLFDDNTKKIKAKRARVKAAKRENPRKIELVCLKNRYGIANYSCAFNYYAANDLFKQSTATEFEPYYDENPFDDEKPKKKAKNRI